MMMVLATRRLSVGAGTAGGRCAPAVGRRLPKTLLSVADGAAGGYGHKKNAAHARWRGRCRLVGWTSLFRLGSRAPPLAGMQVRIALLWGQHVAAAGIPRPPAGLPIFRPSPRRPARGLGASLAPPGVGGGRAGRRPHDRSLDRRILTLWRYPCYLSAQGAAPRDRGGVSVRTRGGGLLSAGPGGWTGLRDQETG